MTDQQQQLNQPRALSPRKLEQVETLQSLNQWKVVFRNYFRRCQFYSYFLQPGINWTNTANRGFIANETSGLKRTPELLASDLEGFLECLASYLPFDYVSDKLLQESTNMDTVWSIIYEIYDVEINTTHYLDYATMSRNPQETYRNYFNRLVGFVRQHLPSNRVEAEGVKSPVTGEALTIGLLDSIAVHWLLSIDRRLINIVKTEFASDLKTKRLCQMVKTIAVNIDELLQRYGQLESVNTVTVSHKAESSASPYSASVDSLPVDMIVRRLERLEQGRYHNKAAQSNKLSFTKKNAKKRNFCSHCSFINRELDAKIDVKHDPFTCNKKRLSVRLIETLADEETQQISSDDDDYIEGELPKMNSVITRTFLQRTEAGNLNCADPTNFIESVPYTNVISAHHKPSVKDNVVSDKLQSSLPNTCLLRSPIDRNQRQAAGTYRSNQHLDEDKISATLHHLASSDYPWNNIQKARSPRIRCELDKVEVITLVDSGAELNVIDANVAKEAGLVIVETQEVAKAANQLPLDIVGRTSSPVTLKCHTDEGFKMIYLGLLLVVNNLGVSCLIGEPGKESNNIICLPKRKLIILAGGDDIQHTPYYSEENRYHLARAQAATILQPGDQIYYKLPSSFSNISQVAVSPRKQSSTWLSPGVHDTTDGHVYLTNCSTIPVKIKKSDHLADVRDTVLYQVSSKPPFTESIKHPDTFQFTDHSESRVCSKTFIEQLKVDPDGILAEEEKDLFKQLHLKYAHLFTTQPGRYNGHYGFIDNKLQFSAPPAPNSRTYIPNYSPSMNLMLAQKMDILEQWGVLVSPEQVGVSVQFVSPSMLVPKPDSDDYRLVTDFAALNVYLKRIPNTSATISQAKARISRAKHVVHLDLANYFYQCGMQKNDIKYLGTVHPFKGLKVYTCDPQGLKGASERSYEKLLRIYGDLIQTGQLAQMADGLHVLGDSIPELAANYEEVLRRADLCNLTFKPSKVVVCPQNISLFGWDLKGQTWLPTLHTTSTLVNASLPKTVKQLRSFLGSFKQLSASLPRYAVTIHKLEQIAAGKKSAERIVWTEPLTSAFEAAKLLAANPVGIAEPRPDDQLQTYSDYSADTKAVGGRLIILRKLPNGDTQELVGGFFSVVLKHKSNWIPCEGEAAGIRLVLEHFRHYIRESKNVTTHFTDSLPCVLAWRRSLRGAFSTSSRISAFLTGLSTLSIELRHKAGKLMFTSDFASRHPAICSSTKCQICQFAQEWEEIGDRAANIKSISVEDIKQGRLAMPMTQKNTWFSIQKRDPVHTKLTDLIKTQQLPENKKTNGNHTKVKLLHNLYTQGKLFIDKDGLILVKSPGGKFNDSVISVPPSLFPGVANALHLQLDHPSKTQLSSLIARYFYSPGWKNIIDEITDNCHQCAAVKKLPRVLLEDTSDTPQGLGTNFAADVIERYGQKILVLRENLSQYTRAAIVNDQTAESLKTALLSLVIDLLPESGATIRVDGATSFQALQNEAQQSGTILNKLKINIVIGRLLNVNKNPTAENANQELLKEILRLTSRSGPIDSTELMIVLKNINSRIRYNGLTPKEILFRRDVLDNNPIEIDDENIKEIQAKHRQASSISSRKTKSKTHTPTPQQSFSVGDLVFLRAGRSKNVPRELYIVEDQDEKYFLIRKLNKRLRQRLYRALPDELILAPCSENKSTENSSPHSDLSKENEQHQLLTPAGRPLREAAKKAHGIATIVKDSTTRRRQVPAHGWLEEDQIHDFPDLYAPVLANSQPTTPDSLNTTSSLSPTATDSEGNSSSDTDVSWTSSPENHCPENANLNPDPFPHSNVQQTYNSDENHSFQNQLTRRYATSDNAIVRPNAFKYPPDGAVFNCHSQKSRPDDQKHPQQSSGVRVPRPTSMEEVNLNLVNDISALPLLDAPQSLPPELPKNQAPPEHALAVRQRRVKQPFNYRVYHSSGSKELPKGGGRRKDEKTT